MTTQPPMPDEQAWSQFWQGDHRSSCGPSVADACAEDWSRFFAACPDGGTILDLGTGNGALVDMALAATADKSPVPIVTGIDVADIRPHAADDTGRSRAVFHARTSMESLPFAAAHFDLVGGQFAIEYSKVAATAAEAMRVLKPGGAFRFLMHGSGGIFVTRSARQCAALERVVGSGLFDRLHATLTAIEAATGREDATSLDAARRAVTALKRMLDDLAGQHWHEDTAAILASVLASARAIPQLSAKAPIAAVKAAEAAFCGRLEAQIVRFRSLATAALDNDQAAALAALFERCGAVDICLSDAGAAPDIRIGYWLTGRAA